MMQRRHCLRWAIGLFGAGVSAQVAGRSAPALIWRERALLGFGTTLWLKAGHPNADQLDTALNAAVAAIRQVESQMSLFDPGSALSRLNAQGQLRNPDVHLLQVLSMARKVSAASDGAFDASMQPLWQLWSQASGQGALPSQRAIDKTRALVNWRAIEVSPAAIRLNQPGMQLSLNGIAQGYASDLVRTILQAHGIQHALIDTGETSLLGQAPNDRAWTFGIEDAAHKAKGTAPLLVADGRAIATSSDAHTVFSADHQHHHILDPHTGYSPTHWSSVSVLAPSCTLADALTKVFFTLPAEQVLPVARRWQVDVVLQDKAGHWTSTL
jgi:thiamine biosynthesis lipoprotein